MKMTVRRGVFESNSSSTHTVAVANFEYSIDDALNLKEHISVGEFGWGYDEYNDSINKLSYFLTYAARYKSEILDYLKKAFPNCTFEEGDDDDGYIDHGYDVGSDIWPAFAEDMDLFRAYILDPASLLIISSDGGDNPTEIMDNKGYTKRYPNLLRLEKWN